MSEHGGVRDKAFARWRGVEWPTLALLATCYGVWALGTTAASELWLPLGMVMVALSTTLHSSLSHEMLHGHPFKSRFWNGALVFPALSLVVPYMRFKDTHLAHHRDSILTDPYDDPESNYLDPKVWQSLPRIGRALLKLNNRLAGRMAIGPILGLGAFLVSDLRAILAGDRRVMLGWALHVPSVGLVIWWMSVVGQMPGWAFGLSVYAAWSILKIRTFLEHRADQDARGRTVVVEANGLTGRLLAWLFLNNNLHVVHHMHATVPWYRLPYLYRANRDRYLSRNRGYRYHSYGEVIRRYFWRAKDPVPHPLWPR